MQEIYVRYQEIISYLKITFDLKKEFNSITQYYTQSHDTSYLYSRGEYLISKIIAKYLGYTFVDSKKIIKFDKKGKLLPSTYTLIRSKAQKYNNLVIPGFYGAYKNQIKIFSRGGSDISGAIVAKALSLDYNNYTDVDGIYDHYPLTQDAKILQAVSYEDMKFLGLFGFGVLHHKCCDILKGTNLTIHLKNTLKPLKSGSKVQNAPSPIFACSKKSMLWAHFNGEIDAMLKSSKIYVYLKIYYQNVCYCLLDTSSEMLLKQNNISYIIVEVTATVSQDNISSALPLTNNHYLTIKKST